MITSVQNSKVKEWKKLHKRKYRNRNQQFLVEGIHLVEEALKSDWLIQEVILREDTDFGVPESVKVTIVSEQVFNVLAETESPQGIVAVVGQKQLEYTPASQTLLIDSVQDPGNLGTLIRTADAAGFDHIILGEGTVDPYNEKTIRATQGSLFHIPIFQGEISGFINELKKSGVSLWASTLQDSIPYNQLPVSNQTALIVGNEGQGISTDVISLADEQVYIPIYGQAESLNVAIAAAVLMYYIKS